MKTVFVRYGHSVRTKWYTEKLSESRNIDENDIVQWIETFGIFRWLAAGWRLMAFVHDIIMIIGNMAGKQQVLTPEPIQAIARDKC